eukprot:Sspe_Gene.53053::Locus_29350_Transcript_1_1_Confidence_1.000_Length_1080::g.53053::m.53053
MNRKASPVSSFPPTAPKASSSSATVVAAAPTAVPVQKRSVQTSMSTLQHFAGCFSSSEESEKATSGSQPLPGTSTPSSSIPPSTRFQHTPSTTSSPSDHQVPSDDAPRVKHKNKFYKKKMTGYIKSFNEDTGFGFIECQEAFDYFQRDVFLHKAQAIGLGVGQQVEFVIWLNSNNMPQARNVVPIGPRGKGKAVSKPRPTTTTLPNSTMATLVTPQPVQPIPLASPATTDSLGKAQHVPLALAVQNPTPPYVLVPQSNALYQPVQFALPQPVYQQGAQYVPSAVPTQAVRQTTQQQCSPCVLYV